MTEQAPTYYNQSARLARDELMGKIRLKLDAMQAQLDMTVTSEIPFDGLPSNSIYSYMTGLGETMQECREMFEKLEVES